MLRDFLRERRIVLIAGLRFVCRKPTVETIATLLSLYGGEVLGCRLAFKTAPGLFASDPVATTMLHFGDAERTAAVLATCVDLVGDHRIRAGELEHRLIEEPAIAMKLIEAILEICDAERIIAGMDLDKILDMMGSLKPEPEVEESDAPPKPQVSAIEIVCAGLAERFSTTPFEVMSWPYESILSLTGAVLPALHPTPGDDEKIYGRTRAEWEADGVTLNSTVH